MFSRVFCFCFSLLTNFYVAVLGYLSLALLFSFNLMHSKHIQKGPGKIIFLLHLSFMCQLFSIFVCGFCALKYVLEHPVETHAEVSIQWQVGNFPRSMILDEKVEHCQEVLKITAMITFTTFSKISDKLFFFFFFNWKLISANCCREEGEKSCLEGTLTSGRKIQFVYF